MALRKKLGRRELLYDLFFCIQIRYFPFNLTETSLIHQRETSYQLGLCQLVQGNLWLRKDSGCSRAIVLDDKLVCCFMFLPPDTPDISALPKNSSCLIFRKDVLKNHRQREKHTVCISGCETLFGSFGLSYGLTFKLLNLVGVMLYCLLDQQHLFLSFGQVFGRC